MLNIIIAILISVCAFIIYKFVTNGSSGSINNSQEPPTHVGGGAASNPNNPGNKEQDKNLEQPS